MDIWYKMLEDCNGDKGKAAYKLGFDPCSFDMLGKATISMYYSLPSGLIKKKKHALYRDWKFHSEEQA